MKHDTQIIRYDLQATLRIKQYKLSEVNKKKTEEEKLKDLILAHNFIALGSVRSPFH